MGEGAAARYAKALNVDIYRNETKIVSALFNRVGTKWRNKYVKPYEILNADVLICNNKNTLIDGSVNNLFEY